MFSATIADITIVGQRAQLKNLARKGLPLIFKSESDFFSLENLMNKCKQIFKDISMANKMYKLSILNLFCPYASRNP